ncbi:MAG: DUF4347 domain-containing protein, partial [Chlorobaculum sp.]|nr:DUF4347 domain-containing protein [Chlorobaculum sp.]
MISTVIFIDSRISDNALISSLFPADTCSYLLDKDIDGIDQMLDCLSGLSELGSIRIFSHGSPGSITIGSSVLDASTLACYSAKLSSLSATLRNGGDILLYGCSVGGGEVGSSFIDALSVAFGADVAASDDLTGGRLAGGDWVLEVQRGTIEEPEPQLAEAYPFLLTSSGVTEFRVNTHTNAAQTTPVATSLNGGGFVTAWTSSGQDGSSNGVYAQRITAAGIASGNEFPVNTHTTNHQQNPAVATLTDGSFVVTWQSNLQDGKGYGIYAQRYNTSGNTVGGEIRINTWSDLSQSAPSVTALAGGGFVIAWQSDGQDGDLTGIYGQRFDTSGNTVGAEFRVNTQTTSAQSIPSVTSLESGGFVVAWQSDGQDGDSLGIFAQRYDASGTVAGSEFQINTHTASSQSIPAIASLHDGGFVATWQSSLQDGSYWGVYGQRYDAAGNAVGVEFLVNTTKTYTQSAPSVTALADGGFVVVWNSSGQDGDGYGIYGQRYNAAGARSGSELAINTFVTGDQTEPSVTALDNGGFVVLWQSKEQDGADWGIYARRFDAAGNPVTVGNTPPSGVILIDGIPRSNELLTADTGNLVDPDGVGLFSYQWYANGTAISAATEANYRLTSAEIGKSLNLRVSYTDGSGFAEEVSSEATNPVLFSALKLNGIRTASGMEVQVWLKAHTVADVMDLEFSYRADQATWSGYVTALEQWEFLAAEPVTGTISFAGYAGNLLPINSDTDQLIGTFSFSFVGNEPDFAFSLSDYSSLCNSMTIPDEVDPGVLPEINAPELTGAIADQYTDEDALYRSTFSEALFRDQDSDDGDRLTLTATLANGLALPSWLHFEAATRTFSGTALNADVGTLSIRTTATDRSGLSKSDLFSLTVTNTNDAPVVTNPIPDVAINENAPLSLTVSGSSFTDPDVGDTLVYNATLSDGLALPSWLHFNASTRTFSGTPANPDVGTLSIRMSATDQAGATVTDTFLLSVKNINDTPQGTLSIDGIPAQGQLLTANTNTLSDTDGLGAFTYQWYANGTAISGATLNSFLLSEAVVGRSLSVSVSYNDGHGTAEQLVSGATGAVININDNPIGRPVISGIVRQGETLSAYTSGISDADGISSVFGYQWYSGDAAIPGATSSNLVLAPDVVCTNIKVAVTYTDGHGTTERIESLSTLPVAWPVSTINGEVSFWKTGEALDGVSLDITTASSVNGSDRSLFFENVQLHADGSRSIEVWAHSSTPFESLQLDWLLPGGSEAVWVDTATHPVGWSSLTATTNEREFRVSGFGLNSYAAGSVRLGTLTLSAPDDTSRFELSLVSGEVGTVAVSPFNIIAATTGTDNNGIYQFTELSRDNYTMIAGKDSDASVSMAVTAADALAALKIA